MNKKYFDLIETSSLTKSQIKHLEAEKQRKLRLHAKKIDELNKKKISELPQLYHVKGKVIISINLEEKNSHTFESGQKIYIGRQFNNLNRRETEPVNAFVVDAEYIPRGVEILIHPNAINDTNKIFGFGEDMTTVRYYSIPEEQCYLWKDNESQWQPLKGYATGLRVFKEYQGPIVGIEPEKIKDVLYITSGELKGKVVKTLKACDYEIIYMGKDGKEERIIRCRHFENEINEREEVIAIDKQLTKEVENKNLMVGVSKSDAKYIIFTL
jgi:hypothetical protein